MLRPLKRLRGDCHEERPGSTSGIYALSTCHFPLLVAPNVCRDLRRVNDRENDVHVDLTEETLHMRSVPLERKTSTWNRDRASIIQLHLCSFFPPIRNLYQDGCSLGLARQWPRQQATRAKGRSSCASHDTAGIHSVLPSGHHNVGSGVTTRNDEFVQRHDLAKKRNIPILNTYWRVTDQFPVIDTVF